MTNEEVQSVSETERAHACWIEMDVDTEFPVICFDTDSGTHVFELSKSAAIDLRNTVVEHGVVEPRRYDHSDREPEDTAEADATLREALGEDYDL